MRVTHVERTSTIVKRALWIYINIILHVSRYWRQTRSIEQGTRESLDRIRYGGGAAGSHGGAAHGGGERWKKKIKHIKYPDQLTVGEISANADAEFVRRRRRQQQLQPVTAIPQCRYSRPDHCSRRLPYLLLVVSHNISINALLLYSCCCIMF